MPGLIKFQAISFSFVCIYWSQIKWAVSKHKKIKIFFTDQLIVPLQLNHFDLNCEKLMAKNISTVVIKAPVQKVWDALTMPEFVKQWQYGSDLITDWKPGSDIRFRTEW